MASAESELITDLVATQKHSVKRGPGHDDPPRHPQGRKVTGASSTKETTIHSEPSKHKRSEENTVRELNMGSYPGAAKMTLFSHPGH